MQCEFSWSHVQRTSIQVAAATSIQFSSDIYISENTIPREKRASIEMLIDRNVEIKQDLRISLPLRGSLGPGSSQLPKTFELYLLVRVLGSNNNYRQSRDNFRQHLRKFLTRIPMIFRQVLEYLDQNTNKSLNFYYVQFYIFFLNSVKFRSSLKNFL